MRAHIIIQWLSVESKISSVENCLKMSRYGRRLPPTISYSRIPLKLSVKIYAVLPPTNNPTFD